MHDYTTRAVRWSGGGELHVEGVGVTQVRTLGKADQQVRDFIESMDPDLDASSVNVEIVVELDGIQEEARAVRELTDRAQQNNRDAARRSRVLVQKMRERGLSVADMATLLGVTRGRISQLIR